MLGFVVIALLTAGQQPPVPQPFPRPSVAPPVAPVPQAPTPTAPPPATSTPPDAVPSEATLGLPVYPAAQFIASYDAGRGQRYYIFGSQAPFMDLVVFYRTALRQKGEILFDSPATYLFEVGKYREETMAFAPSVTIKDFQSAVSEGYPNPNPRGEPARFRSIIQIVPTTER